ncbi:iron-sulfur cluster insertion protein ErpA [Providencia heimbachae]|uniref:Iron-sulfur cluster insertion protein ErpA n=1 Tax=Providencia heimbachae ATCC 35613 TaxID=1354272 RepID=A0A1B7JMM5_9GAMM|nr:iron-sulfur cluster insertion protein ErpA [Providencia heimbachae]MDD9340532.1 iron-sulfur cluster insertion protein ErpA [Providencia heimbachae]NIH21741.1 iron-sulfur cluster insertion protein ErpA [Providencia heimbachae]OAT49157.1 putative HesB family iron-binding protein [Providencia heimbachae ATCC 35613]QCJ69282.1 iron-sulfur cluster insertion protein ErpA [Providencia heimbachae]SQH12355.1 Iron-sulfur cluster insertion protein erpA [Providencia heimbachae]
MNNDAALPLQFTDAAAIKVKDLVSDEDNPNLRLRVYITGGGCSGFQYGFTFDDQINDGDMTIEKQGVALVVDPMSLQYLVGGSVDYTEGLEGSRFIVTNPNAKSTCGCGSSFSV